MRSYLLLLIRLRCELFLRCWGIDKYRDWSIVRFSVKEERSGGDFVWNKSILTELVPRSFGMRQFYLIRHAQSLRNAAICGGGDPGLSPLGRAQAAYCAENLAELAGDERSLIVSSPFERCLDTAGIIVSKLPNCEGVLMEPALSEGLGDYNVPIGYKPDSLREKSEKYDFVVGEYDDVRWWSMESETRQSLAVRMAMTRNRLLRNEYDFPVIVCVAHWPTISALAAAMTSEAAMSIVDNAAITKISYDNGKFKAELVNDYVYGTD